MYTRLLTQWILHRNPTNLHVHLGAYAVGWLSLLTALSQVPMPWGLPVVGAHLGTVALGLGVLAWAVIDLPVALGVGLLSVAWAALPGIPWGPGHGLAGLIGPALGGLLAWAVTHSAHTYFHEHSLFLRGRAVGASTHPSVGLADTLFALSLGIFAYALIVLLRRGHRPALRARLEADERRALLQRVQVPWRNWSRNITAEPAQVSVPQTTADLADVVGTAATSGRRVRVVASGFTWSGFSTTSDLLIFCERLDQVEVDPHEQAVWVGAGATNRQVNAILARAGRALPFNVVLETVRMAGLVSMGTHGSGRHTATMSDLVLALEVITAAGEVRVLSAATIGEEGMRAARMGFGLFGVIARVRLRTEPLCQIRQNNVLVDEDEVLARLPELMAIHDSVELFWMPYTDRIWLRTLDRTEAAAPKSRRLSAAGHFLQMALCIRPLQFFTRRWPGLAVPIMRTGLRTMVFRSRVLTQPQAQHHRFWIEIVRCRCVEVGFKVGDFTGVRHAWREARRLTQVHRERGKYPLNLALNLRFIGPSDALMAPAFGSGITCYIEALSTDGTPGWLEFARQLAAAWLAQPGALPHWAKEIEGIIEVETLPALIERRPRFLAALRATGIDPEGAFQNPLVRRMGLTLLGSEATPQEAGSREAA